MKTKTTLLILIAAALMCETLLAQTSYRRSSPVGPFQVPAFWTPFDPVNFPPQLGPGGANDNAVFDLGFNFFDTYTITNVGGVNDQLIVEDDSVRLEITDYELVSLGFGSEASIAVGQSTGDVGILILDGAAGSQLSSESTSLGIVSGALGSIIFDAVGLTWSNSSTMDIGRSGNGSLAMLDGTAMVDFVSIGSTSNGSGIATINGSGSTFESSSEIVVGNFGTGMLSVEDGGSVSSEFGTIGRFNGSIGEVVVEGTDSRWSVADDLCIGRDAEGSLTIQDGGSVSVSSLGALILGDFPGASGEVTVDGSASELFVGSTLRVGFEGEGTCRVRNGAQLTTGGGVIGHQPGSAGQVILDAEWLNIGFQLIGREGSGSLRIRTGGCARTTDSAFVGRFPGATGSVDLISSSALWEVDADLVIGGSFNPDPLLGDQGEVSVFGGAICVSDTIFIFPDGCLNLFGIGAVSANTIDFQFAGGEFNFNGGTLHVDTFDGNLDNVGGRLAPGNVPLDGSEFGNTVILGDYTQAEFGELEIEIGGQPTSTGVDFVNVDGNTFLDGDLRLELVDFFPANNQAFTVLISSGDIFGFFDNVGDNGRLETVGGEGSFLVRYGATSPIPSEIVLSDFQPNFILGDVNGDGNVDLLDVAPFVELITNGPFNPAADINMDGEINLLDVAPFIELLIG